MLQFEETLQCFVCRLLFGRYCNIRIAERYLLAWPYPALNYIFAR
jgi:hypothetical protein